MQILRRTRSNAKFQPEKTGSAILLLDVKHFKLM